MDFLHLPLAGVFLTLAAYELASAASRRLGSPAWANPVLISIICLAGILSAMRLSYQFYFESAKIIHWMLGPAVVALAVPLYRNLRLIRESLAAIALGLAAGAISAAASAVL